MTNSNTFSLLLLLIAMAMCTAEPPRFRQRIPGRFQKLRQGRPFLAKQEIAAPYPSAADLKPIETFEEGALLNQVHRSPVQTYGPPVAGSQLPGAKEPEQFAPNPDAEEFLPFKLAPQPRKPVKLQQQVAELQPQPQPLPLPVLQPAALPVVKAASLGASSPVPLTALPVQQLSYYVVNQPFAYSTQFQAW